MRFYPSAAVQMGEIPYRYKKARSLFTQSLASSATKLRSAQMPMCGILHDGTIGHQGTATTYPLVLGHANVPAESLADSRSSISWCDFFKSLRGLSGVDLVVMETKA